MLAVPGEPAKIEEIISMHHYTIKSGNVIEINQTHWENTHWNKIIMCDE